MKRVFGEQAVTKLRAFSLSDNTMRHRIEEMTDDIAGQILAEIKESKLDLQYNWTNQQILQIIVNYFFMSVMRRRKY